MLTVTVLPR